MKDSPDEGSVFQFQTAPRETVRAAVGNTVVFVVSPASK